MTEERIMRVTEDDMWAIHHARLNSTGLVLSKMEKWLERNGWFFKDLPRAPPKGSLACFLDGNALCIVGPGFVDIQESDAVFLELTKKQMEMITHLRRE